MDDEVINKLLLSRAISGVSFNFIAYVEPEIPGEGVYKPSYNSWHIMKHKVLEGLRYTKNRAPNPVTHSLTHSLSLTPDFFYMHGCFYHFCSSMWKRIQQSRLQEPQTMFKTHLTNLVLWFVINMEIVPTEFWTTSRIIMLGGSVSLLQEVYQHFQWIFGICFTAQMTSFQE